MKNTWYTYLVRCNDNSLYAGITTDLSRRVEEHNNSKLGAKYTRNKRPVTLVYAKSSENRSQASKLEYALKKLPKAKKEQLIEQYLINETN
ncbi:GIY-YIG nuclease family protein [Colwellia sp. RSH04]|uniref:GIY-YIG nuclease family protein n=1 Tax=Colwellia sp. RSH04 TaxID=2305464 RepID=UPI000E56C95C|nr:GIY-YIG nuclease family protein [Colwellia sp. RSH04]RHW76643.1 GIY-YIG nuclease family protein [Colwellia sp. RSH04]